MTSNTEKTVALIRRIIEDFIAHTSHLEVGAKEFSSGTYFIVRAHPHDMPKLIGKRGTHVNALQFIVAHIGKKIGTPYLLQVKDSPPCIIQRPSDRPPLLVTSYDAQPIAGLLEDYLTALGFQIPVAVEQVAYPSHLATTLALNFNLVVDHITPEEYAALIVPDPNDPLSHTIIGSLGTLIRACANKAGVRIQIVARRPQ